METVGAYHNFERSKELKKLCYTEHYGNGDYKYYNAATYMHGTNSVYKLECIGLMQIRVGTYLRKLKKSTKGLEGKGKFTDRFIG